MKPAEDRIRQISSLFFLFGMFASLPLWYGPRLFPRLPVWDFPNADFIDTIGSFFLLVMLGFTYGRAFRGELIGLACLLVVLMLVDVMKIQPWVYYYGWMICAGLWSDTNTVRRWVAVAMYLWSGIHKLNPAYFSSFEGGMAVLMAVVPFVEILLAAGLWFPRSRMAAVFGSIALHAGIVVFILVQGENEVVILWNIAIPWINVLLFRGFREKMSIPFQKPSYVLVFLFLMASPAAAWTVWGPDYLCWAVYSERNDDFWVAVPEKEYSEFDAELEYALDYSNLDGGKLLSMNKFALEELRVPFVAEDYACQWISELYDSRAPGKLRFMQYERPFRLGKYQYWDVRR